MTKATPGKSTQARAHKAEQQEPEAKKARGLCGAFNRIARAVGPVAKDTLPALKKFGPLLLAADPPVAAAVIGVVVAGSAIGHGARYLARQRAKGNNGAAKP